MFVKGFWKMSKAIKKIYTKRELKAPKCKRGGKHHTAAFHKIVAGIKAAGRVDGVKSPHAVATVSLRKAGKKLYKS